VSRKSSLTIVAALVYSTTYSLKYRSLVRMWLMMPPRKAMSLPARMGTWMSASALVRVKRGSTWMMVAPRSLASITHWNPTGWHSAMLDPSMTMQSARCRSCWKVVAPPRPKLVPRLGTVELCHMRAWFSTCTTPSPVRSFLMR
jgi:hypothetical protein